jgi:hypothetical protein
VSDGTADSSVATFTIVVKPEDARANFFGQMFYNTDSASTATITLSATIQDITAVLGDSAYDAFAGDIRNAKVTFVNRDAADAPIGVATLITPTLTNPADLKTGTVSTTYTVTLGSNEDYRMINVGIKVDGYYTRNSPFDDTEIIVSKPIPGSITGGGYLINTASSGSYAGTTGSKFNFGFNVKNNKTTKNLQGQANMIIRRLVSGVWRTYQIKTTATDALNITLNTSGPGTGIASFSSKANVTDVTNPLAPVSVPGGPFVLNVSVTDMGEPGSSDKIGVTLWSGSTLLFSSNWTGTKTLEQVLDGGNLQTR